MPNKDRIIEFFVIDIFISIEKIESYFSNASWEKFSTDEKTFSAIMREFEIIGEALKYILNHKPFGDMVNKDWREIIDFRNVISHGYFDISRQEIYEIICEDFPVFAKEFLIFAKKIEKKDLLEALSNAKEDVQKLGYLETLKYLENLEKIFLKK